MQPGFHSKGQFTEFAGEQGQARLGDTRWNRKASYRSKCQASRLSRRYTFTINESTMMEVPILDHFKREWWKAFIPGRLVSETALRDPQATNGDLIIRMPELYDGWQEPLATKAL